MVREILTRAGFKEGKTFKETRFLTPPKSTYAVYMDSYDSRGADGANLLKEHDYTIELYSGKPDVKAEERIEDALDAYGVTYSKDNRYWLQEEQLYQVIYNFNVIEKIRR